MGIGIGAEASGGTVLATSESTADAMGVSRVGAISAGAGASRATPADPGSVEEGSLGLEETGIAEMTRGTVFAISRVSIGCCSGERRGSVELGLAMDVWLKLRRSISILF
jgi:hypothetical protein